MPGTEPRTTAPAAPAAGALAGAEDLYPLTPMQEGMLYESLYAPGSGVYVTQLASRLDGDLDAALLEECWRQVVARHPILRTFFVWGDLKSWAQVVRREVELPFTVEDLSHLDEAGQERAMLERRSRERLQGFDLGQAPLLRLVLFRRGPRRHEVLWSFHHLLLDGWSVGIVLGEVYELYAARLEARAAQLPQRRPFRDYVAWLQRQDRAAAEAFWRGELAGVAETTRLPFGDPGAEAGGFATQRSLKRDLAPELSATLRAFCQRQRITLNTLAQGAWGLVLSRYSGRREVLFGAGVSGRPPELEGSDRMIGLFVNTVPVRVDCPPEARVEPWLAELQGRQLESRRFDYTPLVDVRRWSELPAGAPLFEAGMTFDNFPSALVEVPEGEEVEAPLAIGDVQTYDQTDVPLTLGVTPGRRHVVLRVDYQTGRFPAAVAERVLGHVETVLAGIAGGAERLADVPWLPAAERRQLLADWQGPGEDAPAPVFLHRLFEAQAAAAPDRAAAVADGHVLSYGELERRANRWARVLAGHGVGPESRVGVYLERAAPEVLVALLAVLKAGACYLPLDASYPRERLEWMLEDARPEVLLTVERLAEGLAAGDARVLRLDADGERARREADTPLPADTPRRAAIYVIYTSGSTGRPRGVVADHGSLGLRMWELAKLYELGPGDRLLQFVPLSFDAHVEEIYPVLATGATLVMHPRVTELAPEELLAEVRRLAVDTLHLPAALWHAVVEHLEGADRTVPGEVRRLITGGEAPSPQRLALWARRAGHPIRFWNGYGPTEATFGCSTHEAVLDPDRLERLDRLPIGRPWPYNRMYVLGPDLALLPAGVAGELWVGSDLLTRGYLGRPGTTAERFRPDPFTALPGARMYRTGDQGRWRSDLPGELDFLGRLDDQVKVRGVRVEPGEVEAALAQHPGVAQAVVVVREVPGLGPSLVAFHTSRGPAPAEPEALRSFLAERLPAAMVPTLFVPLDALPLSPNGKVDRRALPTPPRPAPRALEPPRDDVERELVEAWTRVLGVEQAGATDDFFALGGHSLLAVRLVAQIHKRFGRRLPLAALVEARTPRRVAELLRAPERDVGWEPLVPLQEGGDRPPLYCVHPVGGEVLCYLPLAARLGADQPVYGLQAPALRDTRESPSIETMAARYLEALRAVQPAGPYHLCGWSFGAFIAFEMACRLEAAGEPVGGLYVLDTWAPLFAAPPADEDVQMLVDLARDRAHRAGRAVPEIPVAEYRALDEDTRLERYLALLRREELVPADVDTGLVRSILVGYRSRRQAVERYRPGVYGGAMTLFVATGREDERRRAVLAEVGLDPDDPAMGWGRLCRGALDVQSVDGHHETLCDEPQVAALARRLRAAMDADLDLSVARGVADSGSSHT
ncbi:MAG TPA: amino acid adenylation domain-containing protein [Thermoanaerobaculia bacterium]|nr:amino acid adenylation domain-containing protein [Thermoanaerobaculia bacterium]